jgi:uncharacterized protein (DUF1330 family)
MSRKKGFKHSEETKDKIKQSHLKNGHQPNKKFCFKKGHIPWQKGKTFEEDNRIIARENHYYWKGGIRKDRGYISILMPEHPYANQRYVWQHRLIIEKYIDRYLLISEEVHHINGVRDDNRLNNLMAFTSKSVHKRFEKGGNVKAKEIIFDGRDFIHAGLTEERKEIEND